MKKPVIQKWWTEHRISICYSLCIIIAGTLLHFAYDWSGQNALVALFAAVNESVWEHLKLFFVPAFGFTLITGYLTGKKEPDYLWCQTKSILAGLRFMIITYFVYSGITKKEWLWMDIAIFFLAAVFAGIVSGRCRRQTCTGNKRGEKYTGVILLALWTAFVWFTYSIPKCLTDWMPGLFLPND